MLNRILLNKDQVYELVTNTIYVPQEKEKYRSRCISGRYTNHPKLPALAIPGGDIGELALLYAAATAYSFEIDYKKAFKVIADIVGGVEHLSYHIPCSHITEVIKEPLAYSLQPDQLVTLTEQLDEIKKAHANEFESPANHMEGAVLMIKGEFGVLPHSVVKTELADAGVQVYIYHRTLGDQRRRLIAQKLLEEKAVTLLDGLDEEYLYEVLTDTGDTHLFETIKRIASGLPMFLVDITSPSHIKIEELETV